MSTLYCDTSVLAKRYLEEAGSDEVRKLFEQADQVVTSAISELELYSFTEKSKRIHRINSPLYRKIISDIDRDFEKKTINIIEISSEIISLAKRLVRQRHLRPADAIQLATAIDLNQRLHHELFFCCADKALLYVAPLEGLRCGM